MAKIPTPEASSSSPTAGRTPLTNISSSKSLTSPVLQSTQATAEAFGGAIRGQLAVSDAINRGLNTLGNIAIKQQAKIERNEILEMKNQIDSETFEFTKQQALNPSDKPLEDHSLFLQELNTKYGDLSSDKSDRFQLEIKGHLSSKTNEYSMKGLKAQTIVNSEKERSNIYESVNNLNKMALDTNLATNVRVEAEKTIQEIENSGLTAAAKQQELARVNGAYINFLNDKAVTDPAYIMDLVGERQNPDVYGLPPEILNDDVLMQSLAKDAQNTLKVDHSVAQVKFEETVDAIAFEGAPQFMLNKESFNNMADRNGFTPQKTKTLWEQVNKNNHTYTYGQGSIGMGNAEFEQLRTEEREAWNKLPSSVKTSLQDYGEKLANDRLKQIEDDPFTYASNNRIIRNMIENGDTQENIIESIVMFQKSELGIPASIVERVSKQEEKQLIIDITNSDPKQALGSIKSLQETYPQHWNDILSNAANGSSDGPEILAKLQIHNNNEFENDSQRMIEITKVDEFFAKHDATKRREFFAEIEENDQYKDLKQYYIENARIPEFGAAQAKAVALMMASKQESPDSGLSESFSESMKHYKILKSAEGGLVKVKTKFAKGNDFGDISDVSLDEINEVAREKISDLKLSDMHPNFQRLFGEMLDTQRLFTPLAEGADPSVAKQIIESNKNIAIEQFELLKAQSFVKDNMKGTSFHLNFNGVDTAIPFQLNDGSIIEISLNEIEQGVSGARERRDEEILREATEIAPEAFGFSSF